MIPKRKVLIAAIVSSCLLVFVSRGVVSQTLEVERKGNGIRASLLNVNYPQEHVTQELTSGLPNRFIAILEVIKDGKSINQFSIEKVVKYDLWDEDFKVEVSINQQREHFVFSDIPALKQSLSRFNFGDLLDFDRKIGQVFRFRAYVIFNPISEDRAKKIQKWMSRGRARSRNLSSAGSAVSVDSSAPMSKTSSNPLLDSILINSINSNIASADWQSEIVETVWTIGE